MPKVFFKDGTIMEARRCNLKRAIRRRIQYEGFIPYRFTIPPRGWYDFDYWEKR